MLYLDRTRPLLPYPLKHLAADLGDLVRSGGLLSHFLQHTASLKRV